ncbi:hypothetical protein G4V39_05370 [Thermosulfuriphilus ammonigenes]|uniref:Uncharacterized protein n=1 Tax=Thermosulfuriphilus ammonigenes TaxID=1936021 RepID=A0A6G7PVM5_9BACT|nr:hypothetical protein [Thermosulfuriphilus ammonigenes]MBA2848085.1 hypothetical protein [Thermosulfuriphilus ammonigenes]QIJ71735.1 hypothetical protein G4V39_05370 [Thermosulfuriphilus ammonigenes]
MSRKRSFPAYGLLAIGVLVIGEILLFSGQALVRQWFYLIAWWSYIFAIDALIYYLKGNSLFKSRRREFFLLLPWSVFFWLVFEWFNLFLKNWHYVDIIANRPLRWIGYYLSFATVLPGLFETYELLFTLGFGARSRVPPLRAPERLYLPLVALGLVCLVLPVIWPLYFFPLVWGGFIFLLEPINHRFGGDSLLEDWQQGRPQRFYLLLLAGLICGFLWEFWNFWAQAKWVYTVPWVGDLKLFEMPLPGFLGFPPFAVECFVMYNFVCLLRGGRCWQAERASLSGGARPVLVILAVAVHLLFVPYMFLQIDRHTVISFLP